MSPTLIRFPTDEIFSTSCIIFGTRVVEGEGKTDFEEKLAPNGDTITEISERIILISQTYLKKC